MRKIVKYRNILYMTYSRKKNKKHTMRSRSRVSKKGVRRSRRNMRGGGCGCSSNSFLENSHNKNEVSSFSYSNINGGGNYKRRRRGQRGGGWGSFFTGNYALNPIANIGTTSGAYSNANMLYGRTDVDPSPNIQDVSYYNHANMRVA